MRLPVPIHGGSQPAPKTLGSLGNKDRVVPNPNTCPTYVVELTVVQVFGEYLSMGLSHGDGHARGAGQLCNNVCDRGALT